MSTVVVSVVPYEQSMQRVDDLLRSGRADPVPRINFVSWEIFHRVLAPNRMAILQVMAGAGALSIREVSRRVGRDFKGVHGDVAALLASGLLHKTDDGQIEFPYDKIHFDFEIGRSAA
jgi:predicted transcriptional regulator